MLLLGNDLNPGLGVRDPPIVVLQLLAHLLELTLAGLQLSLSLIGVGLCLLEVPYELIFALYEL